MTADRLNRPGFLSKEKAVSKHINLNRAKTHTSGRMITLQKHVLPSFEVVERKGIGHPDTLADGISGDGQETPALEAKVDCILDRWLESTDVMVEEFVKGKLTLY